MSGAGERSLAGMAGSYVPSNPADWPSPPPTTIQDGLDDIAAGEVLAAQSLVWTSEAVTPGGNVFTSWATLAPAIASLKGQKTVTCIGATASLHVTTGNWPGITDVIFVAGGDTPIEQEVIIDDGAIWTSTHAVKQVSLSFVSNNTHNLVTLSGTQTLRWDLDEDSECALGTGTAAFVNAGGTSVMISNTSASAWGPGTLSPRGGSINLLMFNASSLGADAFDAASTTGTILVEFDASSSSNISQTQTAGPTYTFAYAGVNNFKQSTAVLNSGTALVTVVTPAITKQASGSMDVDSTVTGTTSGATTVTAQLKRDATNIGSPMTLTVGAAASFSLSPGTVDTAPDAAGHAYELAISASGGATLTVNATSAQIKVKELA